MSKLDYSRPKRLGFTTDDYWAEYTRRYGTHGPSVSSDCGRTSALSGASASSGVSGGLTVHDGGCGCGCWVCQSIAWGLGKTS